MYLGFQCSGGYGSRSSHPEVFCKKRCSQKCLKIHRKTPVPKFLRPATLLKNRLWHSCFPVNFVKFLRTPFLQNTSGGGFCVSLEIKKIICNENISFYFKFVPKRKVYKTKDKITKFTQQREFFKKMSGSNQIKNLH